MDHCVALRPSDGFILYCQGRPWRLSNNDDSTIQAQFTDASKPKIITFEASAESEEAELGEWFFISRHEKFGKNANTYALAYYIAPTDNFSKAHLFALFDVDAEVKGQINIDTFMSRPSDVAVRGMNEAVRVHGFRPYNSYKLNGLNARLQEIDSSFQHSQNRKRRSDETFDGLNESVQGLLNEANGLDLSFARSLKLPKKQ